MADKFGIAVNVASVCFAGIAALIAYTAVERSQRAWIAPIGAEVVGPWSPDLPLAIKLKFANIGEEPAYRVHFQIQAAALFDLARGHGIPYVDRAPAPKIESCRQPIPDTVDTTYFPSSAVEAYARLIFIFTGGKSGDIDTNGVPKEVKDQTKAFFISGCINYETDRFLWMGRSQRESQFCLYYSPVPGAPYDKGTFEFCPSGNRAD